LVNETEFGGHIVADYYFSIELGIINFIDSDFKDRHKIQENAVILNYNDFTGGWLHRLMMGITFDIDLAIVNQAMHTFKRHSGYLINHITSEVWTWHTYDYKNAEHSRVYDYNGNYVFWLIGLMLSKTIRLGSSLVSFALISMINGLVIRVALLCSNVVIFPMIWCMKSALR